MEENLNTINSPQEEIIRLRKRISELESSPEPAQLQEIVAQAIEEHKELPAQGGYKLADDDVAVHARAIASLNPSAINNEDTTSEPQDEQEAYCQEQIKALLQISQDKGIVNAVDVAKKIDDFYLLDRFHSVLLNFIQNS